MNRHAPPDRRELERRLDEHIRVSHTAYCAACTELKRKLAEAIERERDEESDMERDRR